MLKYVKYQDVFGDVDKIEANSSCNYLNYIFLHYFKSMSKKFVFSVAVKSRKKMVFPEASNVTSVTSVAVNFHQKKIFL